MGTVSEREDNMWNSEPGNVCREREREREILDVVTYLMYSFANTPYSSYLSLPHHPGIYLVSDDGESMSLSDGQNVEEVLFGVAGAAGVRGVVDDDGRSLRVDLSLQVSKVSLPTSVCLQATDTGGEGLMYYMEPTKTCTTPHVKSLTCNLV